jgi:hypothetical protein
LSSEIKLHTTALLTVLCGLSLAACSGTSEPPGSDAGGSAGSGGASATGGTSTGGVGTGGSGLVGSGGTGGSSGSGGMTTAGSPGTGGATAGTGGSSTGGSSTGGSSTGGAGAGGTGASSGAGGSGAGAGGAIGGTGGSGAGGTAGSSAGGGYPENTGAKCMVSAGTMAKNTRLPDPFAMNDGTRITSKAQWECRRNEIKKDIERYEIGTKPEPPMVQATLSGTTLNVQVTTSAGSITLSSTVGTASGAGPHCVAIGMNGNASLISGCVQVPFRHDQVVGYRNGTGMQTQSDPFYTVYPEAWGKVGNYAAWAWGISRIIDGIDQVKTQLNVDMSKIGVQGCSYAGKMALFGGAFDERVALTIAQESGGGGITSWRTSQDFTTRTGTNIEKINNTNYAWFLSSMRSLDPYSLPHDHHELIAMIAPRAVIALGNPGYEWLGDESGYKSVVAAREVFKALGVENNIGYDFTGNHGHCQAPTVQQQSAAAFVNKFLKGMTSANTAIAIQPQASGFDLSTMSVIDWQTPTLQ